MYHHLHASIRLAEVDDEACRIQLTHSLSPSSPLSAHLTGSIYIHRTYTWRHSQRGFIADPLDPFSSVQPSSCSLDDLTPFASKEYISEVISTILLSSDSKIQPVQVLAVLASLKRDARVDHPYSKVAKQTWQITTRRDCLILAPVRSMLKSGKITSATILTI